LATGRPFFGQLVLRLFELRGVHVAEGDDFKPTVVDISIQMGQPAAVQPDDGNARPVGLGHLLGNFEFGLGGLIACRLALLRALGDARRGNTGGGGHEGVFKK
jgi:hypothetical protein